MVTLICPNCNSKITYSILREEINYLRCPKCFLVESLDWWENFEGLDGILNARYWKLRYGVKVDLTPSSFKSYRLFERRHYDN
jgi:Zn-finger nucleic acid-binding protein